MDQTNLNGSQGSQEPQSADRVLNVTDLTNKSITIAWEKVSEGEAGGHPVDYEIWLKENDDADSNWRKEFTASDIDTYTILDLNPDTEYAFFVFAIFGGQKIKFPSGKEGDYMMAITDDTDVDAPTVGSDEAVVTDIGPHSFSIQWEEATDDVTASSDIRYQVALKVHLASEDTWCIQDAEKAGSHTFTDLRSGEDYDFYVQALDEAGNTLKYSVGTVKTDDDEAPVVESKELTFSKITNNSINVRWEKATDNVTAPKDIRYTVYVKEADIPDGAWKTASEKKNVGSSTVKGLAAAKEYVFRVEASDEAGNILQFNEGTAKTLDDTAPVAGSTELKTSDITANGFSILWCPASDNVTEAEQILYKVYLIANGEKTPQYEEKGISSYTFTGLESAKQYGATVEAIDEAGNVLTYSEVKATTLDNIAPVAASTQLKISKITANGFTVEWQPATDNATAASKIRYQVYLLSGGKWTVQKDAKGISSHVITGLATFTEYYVYVKATDEAGNVLLYPGDSSYTPVKTLDDKAPTVSSTAITVKSRTRDTLSIQWAAASDNVTPSSQIRYEVYLNSSLKRNEKGISSHTFTGLAPNTQYTFLVIAYDEAGNPLPYTSATAKTLDNQAPKATSTVITVAERTRNSITIKWTPATDNDTLASQIRYKVFLNGAQKQIAKGISSYTFPGLTPNTQYSFYVQAFDEADNALLYSSGNAKTLDNQAPKATSTCLTVTDRTRNSITIGWSVANDNDTATSQIRYEVYLNGVLKQNAKGISSYQFTGLTPNTQYSFYVKAFDEANNELVYTSSSAKTLDDKAPSVYNQAITISDLTHNSFRASWEVASDNDTIVGQIRYEVYLYVSGSWVRMANAYCIHSHTFTNLNSGAQYYVKVKAFDASGNELIYPSSGSTGVVTKPAPVNRLAVSVRQGATVLRGTNTICLEMTYKYVQYDANGNITGRKQGTWQYKWSNTSTATTVIQLPAGWYIENNQVYIYIDSRRAASAGLNKWKKCSDGYVDVTGGNLILQLSGSYYSYSVRFQKV